MAGDRATVREVYTLVDNRTTALRKEMYAGMNDLKEDLRNEFHIALSNAARQQKVRLEVKARVAQWTQWGIMFVISFLSMLAFFRKP